MAKELMEIGGFITSGAEIVNHDNTLSGNGTVDSPLGLNETVLYDGEDEASAPLSDNLRNYTTFKVFVRIGQSVHSYTVHELDTAANSWGVVQAWGESTSSNCSIVCIRLDYDSTNNKLNCTNRKIINFGTWSNNTATPAASYIAAPHLIYKVIGINRKQ